MVARMWARLRALPADDSGVIALETTLVFPLQLLITMTLLQLAHVFVTAQALQYAVFQGTRTAALEWRGGATEQDRAHLEDHAARVAWVLLSPLNNAGGGRESLAVLPGRAYSYPTREADRLKVSLALSTAVGMQGDLSLSTETTFMGRGEYWAYLTVPVGNALVYQMVGWSDRTGIRKDGDLRLMRMRQNTYFARIWPR